MSGSDTTKRFLLQFCFSLQITSTLGGIQKKNNNKKTKKNKLKQNKTTTTTTKTLADARLR